MIRARSDAEMNADVIVVGGGPAGALTALRLARAGVRTTLLDRASFPRPKPCGDCLSAEATRLLARNGLLDDVLAAAHAELHGWRIYAPAGHCFAAEFSDVAYDDTTVRGALAIERRTLDNILVSAAARAGATVCENAHVTAVATENGAVTGIILTGAGGNAMVMRARHVVGADGLRSVIARRLGAVSRAPHVRKLSLTAHVDGNLPFDQYGEMHVGNGLCAGIAPVTENMDRWNVTIVADAERFGREVAMDSAAFFTRALLSLPAVRKRMTRAAIEPSLHALLASGPFDSPRRRIAFPGASLVGDAAGYFDPFTGQGIFHGMRSAEILADSLIRNLEDGVLINNEYARDARRLTRAPRRLQKAIDVVLARPRLADRAIRRLSHAPAAAQAILDVTGDLVPVRSLFSPRVARSLVFRGSSS